MEIVPEPNDSSMNSSPSVLSLSSTQSQTFPLSSSQLVSEKDHNNQENSSVNKEDNNVNEENNTNNTDTNEENDDNTNHYCKIPPLIQLLIPTTRRFLSVMNISLRCTNCQKVRYKKVFVHSFSLSFIILIFNTKILFVSFRKIIKIIHFFSLISHLQLHCLYHHYYRHHHHHLHQNLHHRVFQFN